jgi:hypothetical protein
VRNVGASTQSSRNTVSDIKSLTELTILEPSFTSSVEKARTRTGVLKF